MVKSFLASAGSRISRSIGLTNRSVGRPCSTKGNKITKKRLAKGAKGMIFPSAQIAGCRSDHLLALYR